MNRILPRRRRARAALWEQVQDLQMQLNAMTARLDGHVRALDVVTNELTGRQDALEVNQLNAQVEQIIGAHRGAVPTVGQSRRASAARDRRGLRVIAGGAQ